jgi:AcrR family transcriptional regulator
MARTALARRVNIGGRPTLKEADERMTRLLEIARRHFLAAGYRESSIDGITREAGIAKKTLYHHFGGKAGLFTAIIETLRRSWIAELRDIVLVPRRPELVLEAVALHLLEVGTRREMIELHRLFLVEAHRFPDLARGNYEKDGSPCGMEPLSSYLRAAVVQGALKIGDVPLATEQFTYLVLGGIRARLLLHAARRPGASERHRIARQAVHIFLAGCKA